MANGIVLNLKENNSTIPQHDIMHSLLPPATPSCTNAYSTPANHKTIQLQKILEKGKKFDMQFVTPTRMPWVCG